VTLEQHDTLQQEHDTQLEKIAGFGLELDTLKQEHDTQLTQLETIAARIDHITEAFEPATEFALFETAIYNFVDSVIKELKSRPDGLPFPEDKIKYAMANFCGDVFSKLVKPTQCTKELGITAGIRMGGGSKKKTNKVWVQTNALTLMVAALQGLVVYITSVDKQDICIMDKELLNSLAHNGGLLDALYSTPNGKKKENSYSKTKADVNAYRDLFRKKAKAAVSYNNAEDAVKAVVAALKELEIIDDVTGIDAVEADVVSQLNKIIGAEVS